MAPLGATLAATVALSVGVALAKAGRERLNGLRTRSRELALEDDERLDVGLRRMALEQLDLAIEQLDGASSHAPDEKAVHETRKALKRLRALLRLLETAVGKDAFVRETTSLRTVAQRLGGARDAEVMLATLDAVLARHPRKLARDKGVRRLRAQLDAEHRRMRAQTLGDGAMRAVVLGELRGARIRVQAWQLPASVQLELAEPGLLRLYGQGRKRFQRAAAGRGDQMLAMHEWRKRVKDLRYVAEMLQRSDRPVPGGLPSVAGKAVRRRRSKARKDARFLRGVATRADELGEILGEDHDLAVLAGLVRRSGKRRGAHARLARRPRKRLTKAISTQRRKLRKRALREGERLYSKSPKRFVERVRSSALSG